MNREEKRQLWKQATIEKYPQGGFLDRLLCAVGLHDWTKWSKPEPWIVEGRDPITHETHTTRRMTQGRECLVCGKVERRMI